MTEEKKIEESSTKNEELAFDAVDLMLEGNLQGQINYSLVRQLRMLSMKKLRF